MIADGFHEVPAGKVAMIVTHLEMTERAATRDISLAEGLSFHPVSPNLAAYRDLFDRVGRDWLWYSRRTMEDATLAKILSDPKIAIYTLSQHGRGEALLELDFREDEACELAFFGLTSTLIGTGSGRYLMNQAIQLAWAQPIKRFHLHTCTLDSPQALDFYIRSGFTPHRRQVEIHNDPRLTGHLPEDAAAHIPIIRG